MSDEQKTQTERMKARKSIRTTAQLTGFEGDPKRKAAIEKAMRDAGIEVIQDLEQKQP